MRRAPNGSVCSTHASRRTSRRRRSPVPTVSCTNTTTTSGNRSTNIAPPRRCRKGRRRLLPRGRSHDDHPRVSVAAPGCDGTRVVGGRIRRRRCAPGERERAGSGRPGVHGRDVRRRHSLPAQQRRVRQEVPSGDARFGMRLSRLRRRRVAGHSAHQLEEFSRTLRERPPILRSTRTTGMGRFPT